MTEFYCNLNRCHQHKRKEKIFFSIHQIELLYEMYNKLNIKHVRWNLVFWMKTLLFIRHNHLKCLIELYDLIASTCKFCIQSPHWMENKTFNFPRKFSKTIQFPKKKYFNLRLAPRLRSNSKSNVRVIWAKYTHIMYRIYIYSRMSRIYLYNWLPVKRLLLLLDTLTECK